MSEKTDKELEKEFYSKDFFFSYSGLNKLVYSPRLFYQWYVLKEREDRTESHLVEGKVVHCLLLDKELFDDYFVIMPGKLPGASNKKIVDTIFRILWCEEESAEPYKLTLKDYEEPILKYLVDNNLHQKMVDDKDLTKSGAKTGDAKRLEKIYLPDTLTYFEFLKNSLGKDIIDQATFDRCEEAVEAVKTNKEISDLLKLGIEGFELLEVQNEKTLKCKYKDLPFGLKGIVDNFVIDYENKTVYINDLKTTSKSLTDFPDSVEYWNYWMQASIYSRLVWAYLKSKKVNDLESWTSEFRFIVIDKYNQVYAFPVTNETMSEWQIRLDEKLEEAKYHYTNRSYELPVKFAEGQVLL